MPADAILLASAVNRHFKWYLFLNELVIFDCIGQVNESGKKLYMVT
jgi:hypothetical protein